MTRILLIAIGAALGANLRYELSVWVAQRWGVTFPYGTLLINVLGSFGIGLFLALTVTRLPALAAWRPLIVTGLLGGFTTFSTFSYETYELIVAGSWLAAALNLLLSVILGLVAVVLGVALARAVP